ncbi:hypothetical protein HHK36_024914 [Tetracentron sinense]|uniref:RING-type domain-containing protein n=1 Tax=Tetracentron sinense TaxID=13715 RepID=A0A835D4P7_TETSI|nr:hypothetical protein HHK36_024914 [Tetracentron sinense]
MAERGSSGSITMSRDDLQKLPCFEFKAGERVSSPVDCAVCLENFNMGDKCRLLPICNHIFHAQCVDSWLLKKPICPICRTSANSPKGSTVLSEGSSHSSDFGIELGESPPVVVGTQLGSNPSPLLALASGSAV